MKGGVVHLKNLKKLNRTQRNILEKLGYEDISNIRYLTERGNVVVFVRGENEEIEIDKQTYYKMK